MLFTHSDKVTKVWEPRGGVFNLKSVVDATDPFTIIDKKKVIPALRWPWQTVPNTRMDDCVDEPFAGHLSGSIVEVLYTFDIYSEDLTGGFYKVLKGKACTD